MNTIYFLKGKTMRLKKPEPKDIDPKYILEHSTQKDIMEKYSTREDMKLWRMNVGATAYPGEPVRYVKFGVKGFSDLHGILPGGRALYIESKRPVGGRQSPDQKTFQRVVESYGALYILAPTVCHVDRVLLPILDGQKNAERTPQ